MINEMIQSGDWLPYLFAFLMGFSMLVYAILDGYDLGVGVLSALVPDKDKDRMIASIGPFWDANETWLVLGVGLLLVAFPMAHGIILTNLYLPVAVMLIGLIFRGVAFDFRAKVPAHKKHRWNISFVVGSTMTAFAQGYMLGDYIIGFEDSLPAVLFSMLIGLVVVTGYSLIGACWLIIKCEGELQKKAVHWAKMSLFGTAAGVGIISLVTPMVSPRIFDKWFSMPEYMYLAPIPMLTLALILMTYTLLQKLPMKGDKYCWAPFAMVVGVFILCFSGLAYSFFPYIVPDQLLIVDAASARESLMIILVGALVVMPIMLAYTVLVYRIFHGKTTDMLSYD